MLDLNDRAVRLGLAVFTARIFVSPEAAAQRQRAKAQAERLGVTLGDLGIDSDEAWAEQVRRAQAAIDECGDCFDELGKLLPGKTLPPEPNGGDNV